MKRFTSQQFISCHFSQRIEEKRTVRDSSGREETTVTRTIGDKSHSVTTRVDPSGIPETTETFTNVDEGSRAEFTEKDKF